MDTQILGFGNQPGDSGNADLIKETSTQEFVADVIEASREAVVLVDFWSERCAPCKQLTPILEKAVNEARGAVRLVKMNVDRHPAVAQQMGVQSIPAVFAFKDGRPVDGFMGALPESQVKEFIKRVAGDDALGGMEEVLETANQALETGDIATAVEVFAAVLAEDQENVEAIAGLAKCYVKAGELDKAAEVLAMTPADKKSVASIASAEALLELARKGGESGNVDELRAAVEKNPNDHQARHDLAVALNSKGDREGALNELLTLMKKDRKWNDEAARKQLLQFFEAWGANNEYTVQGRKELSLILFS